MTSVRLRRSDSRSGPRQADGSDRTSAVLDRFARARSALFPGARRSGPSSVPRRCCPATFIGYGRYIEVGCLPPFWKLVRARLDYWPRSVLLWAGKHGVITSLQLPRPGIHRVPKRQPECGVVVEGPHRERDRRYPVRRRVDSNSTREPLPRGGSDRSRPNLTRTRSTAWGGAGRIHAPT